MTVTLDASTLSLKDVHRLLKLQKQIGHFSEGLLQLERLTETEQRHLDQIRENFTEYYEESKILEGQIQFLFLSPLLWLSGFHTPKFKLELEVGIASIEAEDEGKLIKGQMDILAAKREQDNQEINFFWALIVEAKNSSFDASEGLPQLLTYAFTGLRQQQSVWGLTTNGLNYQFVLIEQGNPPTYKVFPAFSMLYPDQVVQLLQVLKAICKASN